MSPGSCSPWAIQALPTAPARRCSVPSSVGATHFLPHKGAQLTGLLRFQRSCIWLLRARSRLETVHEAGRTSSRQGGFAGAEGTGQAGGDLPQDSPAPSWLVQDRLKSGGDLGAEFPRDRVANLSGCRNTSLRPCPGEPAPPPLSEAGAHPAGQLWGGSAQTRPRHPPHSRPHCPGWGRLAPGGRSEATPSPGALEPSRGSTQRAAASSRSGPGPCPGAAGDTAGWQGGRLAC